MLYYLFWYNKTQSRSFLIQLETTMQSSEIRTKVNLWRKILGEILKGLFVTVESQRCPDWKISQDLINGGCGTRMSWLENVLKINKRRGTSIRDLKVTCYFLPQSKGRVSSQMKYQNCKVPLETPVLIWHSCINFPYIFRRAVYPRQIKKEGWKLDHKFPKT